MEMHEKKLTVIRAAANLRYSTIEIFRGEDGDIVWFKSCEYGLDVGQFLRDLDKCHGASELGRQALSPILQCKALRRSLTVPSQRGLSHQGKRG